VLSRITFRRGSRASARRRVDIALLVNQAHALDHHAELMQQFADAGGRALIIWPSQPGAIQGGLKEAKDNLEALGIDVEFAVMSSTQILRAFRRGRLGALLTQTPFLAEHHAPTFAPVFAAVPLIYLGYGLDVFSSSLSMSGALLSRFSLILAASAHHAERLIRSGIAREKVLVLGHPSVYRLRREQPPEGNGTPTLLWQPHWTREFSTWELALPVILNLARTRRDIHVRISPHPLLEALTGLEVPVGYDQSTQHDSTSSEILGQLRDEPNVSFTWGPLLKDIQESDICVTDGKAMIGFFGLTGKPMAVTKSPGRQSTLLSEYQPLATHWMTEDSPENVAIWIDTILDTWEPGMKSAEAIAAGHTALPTFELSPGAALAKRLLRG
jgi:hypothetical protein